MDTDYLLHSVKVEMRNTKKEQNQLYEKHYMSLIRNDAGEQELAQGYSRFIDSLNGFHIDGFEQTIEAILQDDEKVLDEFTTKFESVPEYIKRRDSWQEETTKIAKSGDPHHIKESNVNALDIKRTRAHNRVIHLFNSMNAYAEDNNLLIPYPTTYHQQAGTSKQDFHRFMEDDPNQRNDVSNILTNHMTLLERVNSLVKEKYHETGQTQTTEEKQKNTPIGELAKQIQKDQERKKQEAFDKSVEELSKKDTNILSK